MTSKSPKELEEEIRLLKERLTVQEKATETLERENTSLLEEVFEKNETLTSIIKNLKVGVLLENEEGKVIYTNELFRSIFRISETAEEMMGNPCSAYLGNALDMFSDPQTVIESTQNIFSNRLEVDSEIIEMKDGSILKRHSMPLYLGNKFYGMLWQYKDVTEQQKSHEKIKESEEKYRGIIENMQLGLLEVDLEHNIVRANDSFCKMMGYSEDELKGNNAVTLFLPPNHNETLRDQDQKRQGGEHSVYELELRKRDGTLIWALISGGPLYDQSGNIVGSIGIHYDITYRKVLEEELKQARNAALRSRDAEKEFLANMSHEIRNPINAIYGLTNLLYDTKPTHDQLGYLDTIKHSTNILLGLVSDILDISKIESGKLELAERSIDLHESLDAIIKISSFNLSNKPIRLEKDMDPAIDFPVKADPTVFNQILLNLIGNAIKFTEEGNIQVSSKLIEKTNKLAIIQFQVKDSGIGISPERLETIFESFQQADKETKLKYGGTGLGLSIVKRLVGMYRGQITAESQIGKGSTFTFDLIFNIAKEEFTHNEETALNADSSKRLLIVEDNLMNQQYLSGILKKWGLQYDLAENGQVALELTNKHSYDLILMDIRMPVMDGYETTIRLRNQSHNLNHKTPIIALTASALVDEREKALSVGMNHHMSKPFTPEQLAEVLQKFQILIEMTENNKTYEFASELDGHHLMDFYGGDKERMRDMMKLFLDIIDSDVQNLRKHYGEKNLEEAGITAHKIKPSFYMVGLKEFGDLMQKIESLCKNDPNESEVDNLMNDFNSKFENGKKIVENEIVKLTSFLASHEVHNSR